MPDRVALTVQPLSRSGIVPAYVAGSANNHVFDNTGENVYLYVINADVAPITVTIVSALTALDGMTLGAKTVAVANATKRLIGPFPKALYEKSSTGIARAVEVNLSAVANVTLGAFQLPGPTY